MEKLIWIDTETTGLEPEKGAKLLEVACLATDVDLNPLDDGISVVIHQSFDEIENADFHRRGDLLGAVEDSILTVEDAEALILGYVIKHVPEKTAPMCGNTIGFDRKFLAAYMPELHAWFHYRNIDVSTVKELSKRWNPGIPEPEKKLAHRALADIYESIAELKYYRERVFR